MNEKVILTIASLLSILLATLHMSDDVVRGFEPGGFENLRGMGMMVVWLFGTLTLSGRLSGYIIMILGSMLGTIMPMAHMRGQGLVGGDVATSGGAHFFVWTLVALGVVSMFSLILSVRGLWGLRRGTAQVPGPKSQGPGPEALL